jgi:thymidylate synthase (FAD)
MQPDPTPGTGDVWLDVVDAAPPHPTPKGTPMSEPIPVLDHGFVRLIETWGHGDAGEAEAGIIEAARQSTQGSFRGWGQDEKLLRFLFCNHPPHATPFEFAGMVIEVKAPIFVFREWHRHRTQSYNEMSARYSPLPDENYVPTVERLLMDGGRNKQAQGTGAKLDEDDAHQFIRETRNTYAILQDDYARALESGVPKELARIVLPVGRYSQMRAATSLRNWLAFLTLRMDPGAQWEIRQYAEAVGQIVAEQFPRTWALFSQGRDSATGFDRAPDRYSAKGRETIDRLRDDLGDEGFVAFCVGNAIKYEDRAGLKGSAAEDHEKAGWYRRMAAHVRGEGPDPRSSRPGFVPYARGDR